MTKDDALKLALEFIENSECGTADLEARIKKALAQPEQEPVAWVCHGVNGKHDVDFDENEINAIPVGTMLYTTPPQRKPLTDDELFKICMAVPKIFDFARAIEAAHGIKENT